MNYFTFIHEIDGVKYHCVAGNEISLKDAYYFGTSGGANSFAERLTKERNERMSRDSQQRIS